MRGQPIARQSLASVSRVFWHRRPSTVSSRRAEGSGGDTPPIARWSIRTEAGIVRVEKAREVVEVTRP